MPTRRELVAGFGAAGALAAGEAFAWLDPAAVQPVRERFAQAPVGAAAAADEALWYDVQQAFRVDRTIINLNNGGVSPAPGVVQDAMARYLAYSNEAPVRNMWRILEPQKEGVRGQLARHFGCDAEEMAITRNASEGLQICQFGFDLERGDEVLTTDQDYPRMLNTFRQRERREGVKLVTFPIPVPAEDPAEIVRRYEERITPRTRLILVSHVINKTGQVMPVREVVALGRRRGIPVIVDGAHAFAQFPFSNAELDCDYYATSLHKWLFAPLGTGMLFVRRERIEDLWPLMASREGQDADIRKFEEIGTHPAPNYLAVGAALAFHEGIGAERKAARLRHLRDLWADALRDETRIRYNSSFHPEHGCVIANVAIDGIEPRALSSWLWERHRVLVAPIGHADCSGIRVTPSVYTTASELERFVDAMRTAARRGIA